MQLAHVLINIPTRRINKLFSYAIPPHLDFVGPGWRVWVPFGVRKVEGFVIAVENGSAEDLKEIIQVWDSEPWFDAQMMTLARWLADHYLCSLGEAFRLFVPGGSSQNSELCYRPLLKETLLPDVNRIDDEARAVWLFLQKNEITTHKSVLQKFGASAVKPLKWLIEHSLIVREFVAKAKGAAKYRTEYILAVTKEQAQAAAAEMRSKTAQRRALEQLLAVNCLEETQLKEYKITKPVLHKLIMAGLVAARKVRLLRDSYEAPTLAAVQHTLTAQQRVALEALQAALARRRVETFLLHGITGSGKTQVYIEAVEFARKQNRQAIILVPEIALTGQLVERFRARFGSDVVVIHSKLPLGERNDAWEKMRLGQAGIAIGARSAVFAPFPNLGLVILDEEHEFTYKQEETPRYHARDVAIMRCKLAGAVTLLGSATPSIETYYRCLNGEYTLLQMPHRVNGALANVSVVDMREELKQGNRSVISAKLQEMLAASLARGEQAIILLNRRGYATFVLCRECGHVIRCEHCSVSLVYHATGAKLKCHYCQRSASVPDQCPKCRSRYIRYFGSGTQKVEEELKKLFPQARVLRMDQDTTGGKLAHDRILQTFAAGQYDILLGTQMVAKGHDIQNVTAVGVIAADAALNLPDFRAAEKTFALIMQAAGRAGRGQQAGRVVVQTYNPEHYAIQAGARQDYLSFYHAEIAFRKTLGYPPFRELVKITVQGPNESGIRSQAEHLSWQLKNRLQGLGNEAQVLGPFAAAISKVDDIYRMNILIKTEDVSAVRHRLTELELNAQPGIIIDVNPVNAM